MPQCTVSQEAVPNLKNSALIFPAHWRMLVFLISVIFSLVPPAFLNPDTEVLDLTVGSEISLNCTATGNPTPVYSWQSSNPEQERVENEAVLTSSLLLPGTYTCTASNTLEKKSKQFIVKAKTKGGGYIFEMHVCTRFHSCPNLRLLFCFYLGVWITQCWEGIRWPYKENSAKEILLLLLWRQKWQCIYNSTDIYQDLTITQN